MPRPFAVTMESPATVDQVHGAFGDRDYWVDRLTHFGGAKSLEELTVGEDGTITIAGKDITIDASGKINVKASGNITMKSSQKILQN